MSLFPQLILSAMIWAGGHDTPSWSAPLPPLPARGPSNGYGRTTSIEIWTAYMPGLHPMVLAASMPSGLAYMWRPCIWTSLYVRSIDFWTLLIWPYPRGPAHHRGHPSEPRMGVVGPCLRRPSRICSGPPSTGLLDPRQSPQARSGTPSFRHFP